RRLLRHRGPLRKHGAATKSRPTPLTEQCVNPKVLPQGRNVSSPSATALIERSLTPLEVSVHGPHDVPVASPTQQVTKLPHGLRRHLVDYLRLCPEVAFDYQNRVTAGRRNMRAQRAVLCGLARSLSGASHLAVARLRAIGAMFGDYRVVIYENDSDDSTPAVLNDWMEVDARVVVISERLGIRSFQKKRSAERADMMATFRNRYHDVILDRFSDYDYVVVLDTDLERGVSRRGLANTFGWDEWDSVGSNGILLKHII